MDNEVEIKPVKDWDGYGVSNDGRVWTRKNKLNQWREMKMTVTKPGRKCIRGYVQVILRSNGLRKAFKVHRLVVTAFLMEIECGYEVNHIDGEKTNNDLSNLEVVTHLQNMDHAKRCGLITEAKRARGSYHGSAKLDENEVRDIRLVLANPNITLRTIAKQYGVSRSLIKQIKYRTIWKHVA